MLLWILSASYLLAAIPKSCALPQQLQNGLDQKRENSKQLTKELQPYLEEKKTGEKAEQELSELSDALVEARDQIEGPASTVDKKQEEIDQIRDENQ
ncbi:hypothetical protein OSTOST_01594 [Ostertagia ostertagi]